MVGECKFKEGVCEGGGGPEEATPIKLLREVGIIRYLCCYFQGTCTNTTKKKISISNQISSSGAHCVARKVNGFKKQLYTSELSNKGSGYYTPKGGVTEQLGHLLQLHRCEFSFALDSSSYKWVPGYPSHRWPDMMLATSLLRVQLATNPTVP